MFKHSERNDYLDMKQLLLEKMFEFTMVIKQELVANKFLKHHTDERKCNWMNYNGGYAST